MKIFSLLFLAGLLSVHGVERSPLLGGTESSANLAFGIQQGRMETGDEVVLIYPESVVHLQNGKIDSIHLRDMAAERELRAEQAKLEENQKKEKQSDQMAREKQQGEDETARKFAMQEKVLELNRIALQEERRSLANEALYLRIQQSQPQFYLAPAHSREHHRRPPVSEFASQGPGMSGHTKGSDEDDSEYCWRR